MEYKIFKNYSGKIGFFNDYEVGVKVWKYKIQFKKKITLSVHVILYIRVFVNTDKFVNLVILNFFVDI